MFAPENRRAICQACPAFRHGQVQAETWCERYDDQPAALRNCEGARHGRWQARLCNENLSCGHWLTVPDPCPVCAAYDPLPGAEIKTAGWPQDPLVAARHVAAFAAVCAHSFRPPSLHGAGIVTVLYGNRLFWPQIVVQVRLGRQLGIRLPWFVFHDQDVGHELDGQAILVDVRRFGHFPRKYDHWAMKTFALGHCGLEKALYLDGDAYLLADPEPLFALLTEYRFVYWENLEGFNIMDESLIAPLEISLPRRVQGGHYLINCKTAWQELMCACWYNHHADFWWQRNTSDDESGWRMVLGHLHTKHLCLDFDWQWPAFVCRYGGTPFIVHRCQEKLRGDQGCTPRPHLPRETEVFDLLAGLYPKSRDGASADNSFQGRKDRVRTERRRLFAGAISPG